MKTVESKTWSGLTQDSGIIYSDPNDAPDNINPTDPGTPVVTANGSSSLYITWAESTDAHGIKEYILYRSTTSGGSYTEIGRPLTNSWTDEGLSPSTTRYYKVRAIDNSLQMNQSGLSAYGSGTTGAGATGPWQLGAGRFAPSDMPMVAVHPRPDNETNTFARHRWAYYDGVNSVQYRIPIIIQGGAPPFYYEVVTGPPGMTIGQQFSLTRGDDYGVLKWTPTGGELNTPVSIRVSDQEGNTILVNFTISTASTSRFLFVSTTGSDSTGTGTISNPFATTRGWFKTQADTTYAGYIVYYRSGTHTWHLDTTLSGRLAGNGDLSASTKPLVHLGYPGETVISDFSECRVNLINDAADFYFGGMTRQNTKLLKSAYMFYIRGTCQSHNGGGARFTLFEAPLKNHRTTFLKATEDFTGTNARDETYEWVNVAGTNEYYVTGPGGIEIFESFGSADRPNNLTANGTAYTRVASGALATSQYKWAIPSGRTDYTIVVRMNDDSNPGNGTNVILTPQIGATRPWPGTVGTNTGSVWSDEASKIGGVNGKRYYFADVRCDKDNVGAYDTNTSIQHYTGDNGAMANWILNVTYAVHEFAIFTNCKGSANQFAITKSTGSYLSHRWLDCTATSNDPLGATIKMSAVHEHDALSPNLGTEYKYCKMRITGTNTNDVVLNWIYQSSPADAACLGFISRRNTLINDSAVANKGSVYQGGASYTGYQRILDDLVFSLDSDGWYLSAANGFVSPTYFQRLALSGISSELDANYDVKSGSTYYGTKGATIA